MCCGARLARPARAGQSPHLRSEVDIVCSIAEATLGDRHGIDLGRLPRRLHRDPQAHRAAWCPGCEAYDEKVDRPGGFVLPHPPRDTRTFDDQAGQGGVRASARSTCCTCPRAGCCCRRCAATTSSTPRSTASTTATAASRAAAGWSSCTPTTSPRSGCTTDQSVDLVSEWTDGSERTAPAFRVVAYDQPRGCAAAYYPETNPLVPLDSTALDSNCPTSKSVIVRLEPTDRSPASVRVSAETSAHSGGGGAKGQDEGHKSRPQPRHLS